MAEVLASISNRAEEGRFVPRVSNGEGGELTMRIRSFSIVLLASALLLPMGFMDAVARPTVINVTYSSQASGADQGLTFHMHAFGFPGESLDWSGGVVFPASHESHPSMSLEFEVTSSSYTSSQVLAQLVVSESPNPDYIGCRYTVSASTGGHFYMDRGPWVPWCAVLNIDLRIETYGATAVINT
jgi:hypothetical protein